MTSILRRIWPVLAGLLAIVVASTVTDIVLHALGVYPPWGQSMSDGLFAFATFYRVIYGVAGGYLTARVARGQPMRHAIALGIVGIVLSTAGAAASWNHIPEIGPAWYPLALIASALPCAWLGGRLAQQRQGLGT